MRYFDTDRAYLQERYGYDPCRSIRDELEKYKRQINSVFGSNRHLKEENIMSKNHERKIIITNFDGEIRARLYDNEELVRDVTEDGDPKNMEGGFLDETLFIENALTVARKLTSSKWSQFKAGKFGVHVPQEDIYEFLEMCEKQDLGWMFPDSYGAFTSIPATEWTKGYSYWLRLQSGVVFNYTLDDESLKWTSSQIFKVRPVISFEDFKHMG